MKHIYLAGLFAATLALHPSERAFGQCVSGSGITMAAPAGQTPEMQTFTGNVTSGNATITLSSPATGTAGLVSGMVISGPPGVFAPGTVLTVVNATTITVFPAPTGSFTTATMWVNNWNAATVPANMTITRPCTIDGTGTIITVGTCGAWLTVGTGVEGPGVPPGTTITGGACPTFTLSQVCAPNAGSVFTLLLPQYPYDFPPTTVGSPNTVHCSVCPATFSTTVCAGQYFDYYMCSGNNYTFSMCGNAAWNSTITVTNTTGGATTTGFPTYDNDGCGTTNEHAVLNFIPTTTGFFRIRLFNNPCTVNAGLCGTINVQCSPNPTPPPNDLPENAQVLPVSTACNFVPGTNAFSTGSSGPITPLLPAMCGLPGPCTAGSGSYGGADVWFAANASPTGTLSIQTQLVSAPNLVMAVYTGTPGVSLTQVGGPSYCNSCNDDSSPGVLNPFLQMSGFAPNQTVYIRVWSYGGLANSGSFQICAYHPVPPPNDDPCGAINLPISASCNLTSFTTESALPLSVAMTANGPSCGTPIGGGDVWFTTTVPAGQSVTINTQAGSLTDMAMSVYTLTAGTACAGTLTEFLCSPGNGASPMPSITLPAPGAATTYYIRMWNMTSAFGTASICVVQNVPPPNDQPCGAIALPVNLGCTFPAPFSTQFATVTGGTAPGVVSIQNPSCNAGPYTSDVWFTAVVPGNGQLSIDTDDMQLTDGAIAVYSSTGSCGSSNLALTQIAGACAVAGSANGAQMPAVNLTGLTPGATVYIRVWRQTGNDGNFLICARNPQVPSPCWYTLRLTDSAGDGWNGGYVTLCIGGSCTNYTVYGSLSTIVFQATAGTLVTLSYTAVGGFQNQVGWTLSASTGANIWPGPITSPASSGPQHSMTVNGTCNVPPAPISDCVGAQVVCNNQSISYNPSNTGNVVDLYATNDGCLAGEQQGTWFVFTTNAPGNIAFTLGVPVGTDYDFAVWGPYPPGSPPCPPSGPPLRCNWSATTGPTGLSMSSFTPSVGAVGSPFSQWITAAANQLYILYVDNWSRNGIAFNLTWANTPANILDCNLPVELVEFDAFPVGNIAQVRWTTASEEDLSHFVVERSLDGERFDGIGQLEAMGARSTVTNYELRDAAPVQGVNHYRLRMVDDDGSVQHSKVVPVRFGWSPARVQVYPNPAGGSLWVAAQDLDEGWRWRIVDASGRAIQEGRVVSGSAPFEIALGIESGAYLLEVQDERGAVMGHARFVKD